MHPYDLDSSTADELWCALSGDLVDLNSFQRLLRRARRSADEIAGVAGLDRQQYQLLLSVKALNESGACTMIALSEDLEVRPQTAVELVNRAEARRLVTRRREEEDRRRVLVTLTREGEQAVRRAGRHHLSQLAHDLPALAREFDGLVRRLSVFALAGSAAWWSLQHVLQAAGGGS